uniref:Uncharacterized protein n=1 Tax=Human betaherpesvirus 6 TaxID=10368 RepID=A0A1W6G0J6_9BETA|nr:hypothetical protein [Human betaherpesvirus 6]
MITEDRPNKMGVTMFCLCRTMSWISLDDTCCRRLYKFGAVGVVLMNGTIPTVQIQSTYLL